MDYLQNKVNAKLYYPKSSRSIEVEINHSQSYINIIDRETGSLLFTYPLRDCKISDRIANTPRKITLPNQHILEIEDNDFIDRIASQQISKAKKIIYKLESQKTWILVSISAFFMFLWLTYSLAIPIASNVIAHTLPQAIVNEVSKDALKEMDNTVLNPSELPLKTRSRIEKKFYRLVNSLEDKQYRFQLHFRQSGAMGANAFALPNGDIVLLDSLVNLAQSDEMILAVLAHEMGHVVHKHGMQHMVSASLIPIVFSLVYGDLGTVGSVISGLPLFFMQSSYSRDFERAADAYAIKLMKQNNIDPEHLAQFFELLEQKRFGDNPPEFLSTHPSSQERIETIRQHQH